MHWSPDRNGGFSRADPAALVLPTLMDPLYGYETINVEAQLRDRHSLLHWMRRMLAIRRRHAAFGRGTLRFLYPKNRKVLAFLREYNDEIILCVGNVSRAPEAVELDLSELAGRVPVELNGGSLFPPIGQLTYLLTLAPYGFYWFTLAAQSEPPAWHTKAPEPMPEYITLVTRNRIADALATPDGTAFVRDLLPSYLMKRRWFAAKDQSIKSTKFKYLAPLPDGDREVLLAEIETNTDGEIDRWQLPLSVAWDDEPAAALPGQLALARVRRGRRTGLLTDAFALPAFANQMLAALAGKGRIETAEGSIVFEPVDSKTEVLRRPENAGVLWLSAEQSNSSLIVDDAVMLKIFRKLAAGAHPEAEMSRHLTAQGFANAPPMLGEVVRVMNDGARWSLAVAQGFVRNQGDGWAWTLDQFSRALDDIATQADAEASADEIADYKAIATMIGRRLGEMHAVLARPSEDEAFAPEIATERDVDAWIAHAEALVDRACALLKKNTTWDSETVEAAAKRLLSQHDVLTRELRRLAKAGAGTAMTRIHGDFHLGQVLVASGDIYIIDFEGEPGRPLAARRAKASPLRDVAGLLRSFDYAAAATLDPKRITGAQVPHEQRAEFVRRLRDGAKRAFLDAYRESHTGAENTELLGFFLIEKAAYELAYEAANRPAWLPIPIEGLADLVRLLAPAGRSKP
jgi:maltose alpha-D-glucosyltransferase / alpha-amylase